MCRPSAAQRHAQQVRVFDRFFDRPGRIELLRGRQFFEFLDDVDRSQIAAGPELRLSVTRPAAGGQLGDFKIKIDRVKIAGHEENDFQLPTDLERQGLARTVASDLEAFVRQFDPDVLRMIEERRHRELRRITCDQLIPQIEDGLLVQCRTAVAIPHGPVERPAACAVPSRRQMVIKYDPRPSCEDRKTVAKVQRIGPDLAALQSQAEARVFIDDVRNLGERTARGWVWNFEQAMHTQGVANFDPQTLRIG